MNKDFEMTRKTILFQPEKCLVPKPMNFPMFVSLRISIVYRFGSETRTAGREGAREMHFSGWGQNL